jgi:hypothetical protein
MQKLRKHIMMCPWMRLSVQWNIGRIFRVLLRQRKAALSHTGALAGADKVFVNICQQHNIILAEDMDHLIDIALYLTSFPKSKGNKAAIVTLGGGWGVIGTDAAYKSGIDLIKLPDSLINKLSEFLPEFWSKGNPIDLVAPNRVEHITDSIKYLFEYCELDVVFLLGLGYMSLRAKRWLESNIINGNAVVKTANAFQQQELHLLDLIAEIIKKYNKPVIPVLDLPAVDELRDPDLVQYLSNKNIGCYFSPNQAINAFSAIRQASS